MGIKKSAGLVIVYNDEILLIHPTNANWKDSYQIPKGMIEDFEVPLDAAIRETKEELGLDFTEHFKDHHGICDGIISYKNGKGKTYKKVLYFIVRLNEKIELDKTKLQLDEIDWAGFLDIDEARKKIFWRFKPILEEIK